MHFKILETKGNKAPDSETSRGKEIVKSRAEIAEMESQRTMKTIHEWWVLWKYKALAKQTKEKQDQK